MGTAPRLPELQERWDSAARDAQGGIWGVCAGQGMHWVILGVSFHSGYSMILNILRTEPLVRPLQILPHLHFPSFRHSLTALGTSYIAAPKTAPSTRGEAALLPQAWALGYITVSHSRREEKERRSCSQELCSKIALFNYFTNSFIDFFLHSLIGQRTSHPLGVIG